ncbi:MAG: toluene tolerance protein [Verrucomicrobiaceae bacterium]|nr:toluene tolerance protein [Verrucomicrobiaceae bacterium]
MKNMTRNINRIFLSVIFCAVGLVTRANAVEQDPYKIVQNTTERVLAIVKEGKGYYDKEPDRFNKQVAVVMDEVVDFDGFARGVMGTYASAQRYQALTTEPEKAAFRERIERFSGTFKQGLVQTYAKGLLKFNGEKIETLPPRKGDDLSTGTVAVMQNIYGASDKPYVVQYSMRRNKAGEWKLQNVIIEGINLGQTYRSQFASAADQNHGDLEKVIATWKVEPQAVADKVEADKK